MMSVWLPMRVTPAALRGPARNRDVFANDVVVADFQPRRLAAIGDVLRIHAQRGEGIDLVVAAEAAGPTQHDVATPVRSFPPTPLPHAPRSTARCCRTREFWRKDRRLPSDGSHADVMTLRPAAGSASAAPALSAARRSAGGRSRPPRRRACRRHKPCLAAGPAVPRKASTSTSIRSWSPGVTGRRKRARSMPVNTSSLSSRSFTSVNSNARRPAPWLPRSARPA